MDQNKKIKLGFVVNIANPLNLDVDFGLTDEELEFYKLENVDFINYSYIDDEDKDLMIGKAHRCRMEGIISKKEYKSVSPIYGPRGYVQNEHGPRGCVQKEHGPRIYNNKIKLQSKLLHEIIYFLDRTGGFVKYKITGVDIFKRAIISLFDPVSGESINNLILNPKYSIIYCKYERIINDEKEIIKKPSLIAIKKNIWRLNQPT